MGIKAAILDWREICDEHGIINDRAIPLLTKLEITGIAYKYKPYIFFYVDSENDPDKNEEKKKRVKQEIVDKLKLHNIVFDEKDIFCFVCDADKRRTLDLVSEGKKRVCGELGIPEEEILYVPKGSRITKPFPSATGAVDFPPEYPRGHAPNPGWAIDAPLLIDNTQVTRTYSRGQKALIGAFIGFGILVLLAAIGVTLAFFCPPVAPAVGLILTYPLYAGIAGGVFGLCTMIGGALIGGSRGTSKVERTKDGDIRIEGSDLNDINTALAVAGRNGTLRRGRFDGAQWEEGIPLKQATDDRTSTSALTRGNDGATNGHDLRQAEEGRSAFKR